MTKAAPVTPAKRDTAPFFMRMDVEVGALLERIAQRRRWSKAVTVEEAVKFYHEALERGDVPV